MNYRFSEDKILAELKEYIDKTYDAHYSSGNIQATEFIEDAGHGMGFTLGNVMKYSQRYGKKNGHNRDDLLKIIHYGIIALAIHDRSIERDNAITLNNQKVSVEYLTEFLKERGGIVRTEMFDEPTLTNNNEG